MTNRAFCLACPFGNLSARPVPKQSHTSTFDIGEEWEVDIKGPWTDSDGKMIKSFSGCRYSFVAQDRKSKRVVAFLIRSRTNLVHHLQRLVQFVNSYRRIIKLIRTDNELFKTEAIKAYLNNHTQGRIELESCAPYEHGQLGNVERCHRTFQDCTNKALYGKAHLSSQYCGMAYMDAVFKYNHLPRRSLNFQTPDFFGLQRN